MKKAKTTTAKKPKAKRCPKRSCDGRMTPQSPLYVEVGGKRKGTKQRVWLCPTCGHNELAAEALFGVVGACAASVNKTQALSVRFSLARYAQLVRRATERESSLNEVVNELLAAGLGR